MEIAKFRKKIKEERVGGQLESRSFEYDLLLKRGEVNLARVDMRHFTYPVNFFIIESILVDEVNRGKGVGREILLNINKFLKKKNVPGVLENITFFPELGNREEVFGFYERHGWVKMESGKGSVDTLFYNLESIKPVQIEELKKII